MLNKFQAYLVSKGYKEFSANSNPSTAMDYCWRIGRIIEKEGITLEEFSNNIQKYMELYKRNGERWNLSKRSHESYYNAIKNFRKFILVQRFGGANG